MSVEEILKNSEATFAKAVTHLKNEFSKLQVGRANPGILENLNVSVYGSVQPMKSLANISVQDARTIYIQPWDKSTLGAIEKGISESGLGLNPTNDGIGIRIIIPPLTEERRRELTKMVGKLSEESKITVRNGRHDAFNSLKKMKQNSELTEDDLNIYEKKIQTRVDETNKEIDALSQAKEKDIMTV